jgi:crossover junction endodeoxyribonuclease RuvC
VNLKILGIDPGSKVTGYGIVERGRHELKAVIYGDIRPNKQLSLSARLANIYDCLIEVVEQIVPDAIAIEDVFYGKNIKSLIKQGEVRGVTILVGAKKSIPIFEYTPLEVKKAVVGYGRAEKGQVQKMVKAILNLSELPTEDASDALAIAICHANSSNKLTV